MQSKQKSLLIRFVKLQTYNAHLCSILLNGQVDSLCPGTVSNYMKQIK